MKKLIRNSVCKDDVDADDLLFGIFKPLGDFSSKTNAAYAFGL